MDTFVEAESAKQSENLSKAILRPMLGQDRLQKSPGGSLVRGGEILSPRQTSINKTNACVMDSECARQGLQPTLGSPCSHNGRRQVAGAGHAYDKEKQIGRWCAQNSGYRISGSVPNIQKNGL